MFHVMEQTPTERTAAAVRAELARRKISGRKLAEALDWKPSTAHRRLSGEYPFDIDELAQIAAFLGVPIATLLPERRSAA